MADASAAIDALAGLVLDRVRERLPELLPVQRRLLTMDEAATYLGCKQTHIRYLVRTGRIAPVTWKDSPRAHPYFDVRDLDAAVEARKRKSTA